MADVPGRRVTRRRRTDRKGFRLSAADARRLDEDEDYPLSHDDLLDALHE